jgi:hypothetical protein
MEETREIAVVGSIIERLIDASSGVINCGACINGPALVSGMRLFTPDITD